MTDVYDRLDRAEFRALLQLAAWQVHRLRTEEHGLEGLEDVIDGLLSDLTRPRVVLEGLSETYADAGRQRLLEDWDTSRHIGSEQAWSSDVSGIYRFTVTLLLLRAVSDNLVAQMADVSVDPTLRDGVRADMDAVVAEPARWQRIVGPDIESRVARVRAALEEAEAVGEARHRREVAEAPVSKDAVGGFAHEVREAYDGSHPLLALDLLEVVPDESAYGPLTRGVRELLPKSWFIGDWRLVIGIDHYGQELARDETEAIALALAAKAEKVGPVGSVPADLVAAIERVRERGYEPDIAMFTGDVYARAAIFQHPAFRPETAVLNGAGLGLLDGVPVLQVRGDVPAMRVAANLRAAITWEHHRFPDDRHSVRVMVAAITEERAAEIVERGFRFTDRPDWAPQQIVAELASARVDVRVELDYRVEGTGRKGAAAAVMPTPDEASVATGSRPGA